MSPWKVWTARAGELPRRAIRRLAARPGFTSAVALTIGRAMGIDPVIVLRELRVERLPFADTGLAHAMPVPPSPQ